MFITALQYFNLLPIESSILQLLNYFYLLHHFIYRQNIPDFLTNKNDLSFIIEYLKLKLLMYCIVLFKHFRTHTFIRGSIINSKKQKILNGYFVFCYCLFVKHNLTVCLFKY